MFLLILQLKFHLKNFSIRIECTQIFQFLMESSSFNANFGWINLFFQQNCCFHPINFFLFRWWKRRRKFGDWGELRHFPTKAHFSSHKFLHSSKSPRLLHIYFRTCPIFIFNHFNPKSKKKSTFVNFLMRFLTEKTPKSLCKKQEMAFTMCAYFLISFNFLH